MGFCLSCWLHPICPVHCIDFATFHWKMKFVVKKSNQEQNKKLGVWDSTSKKSSLKKEKQRWLHLKRRSKISNNKKSWYILIQILHTTTIWLLLLILVRLIAFENLRSYAEMRIEKMWIAVIKKNVFWDYYIMVFFVFPHTKYSHLPPFYAHFSLKRAEKGL